MQTSQPFCQLEFEQYSPPPLYKSLYSYSHKFHSTCLCRTSEPSGSLVRSMSTWWGSLMRMSYSSEDRGHLSTGYTLGRHFLPQSQLCKQCNHTSSPRTLKSLYQITYSGRRSLLSIEGQRNRDHLEFNLYKTYMSRLRPRPLRM